MKLHGKQQLQHQQAIKTGKKRKKKYAHKKIKSALVKMLKGKCAYCESQIRHIEYGHIEHFKPKGNPLYYTDAVEWKNLLLACGICNGSEFKGTQFPLAADSGPIINPSAEDPADHLKFEFDINTGLANVLGKTNRGAKTIKVLGPVN